MTVAYSLTERLAQHLARDVDAATRGRARLHLLDWVGCVAGAMRTDAARVVRNPAGLGNILEIDDVHRTALLHPGPVVWPALVARHGLTLGAALDAGVRGYEAMIAVGATFDAHHYAHFHNSATAGGFGAAAAVAAAMELTEAQTTDALGNAGSVAGGVWRLRHENVLTKSYHMMHAVATGTAAAVGAAAGLTGPRFILEGEQGLYAATCRAPRPMTFGPDWRIAEVSFKPWAACRHAHPAIDAALALADEVDLSDTDLEVATYADALAFCDRPDPATPTDAKFSLQHAVAVVVARGAPQLADFEPAAIADPRLSALRRRVRVVADPTITARYPAHFGARVSGGGGSVERVDTLGDPERPLDRAGVVAKFAALMAWGGVAAATDAAVGLILEGDDSAPFAAVATLVERIVGR